MAESSGFAAEAQAFADKARALAAARRIEPDLLRFPCEPLRVAVVVAELGRLRTALAGYGDDDGSAASRSVEWSTCLDEYDIVLEAAAELVHLPVPRLPYGCRRHFRPAERAQIERLISRKVG